MKHLMSMAILGAILPLMAIPVHADPKEDVCAVRARDDSGYKGPNAGLAMQIGKLNLRLSGSVAIGISHSSGSGSYVPAPADAGAGARDLRERKARERYRRVYADCMRTY